LQNQLCDFDNLTTQLLAQAEKEVLPQQEISDTNERLNLKEKQLKEIAEAMRSFSPVDELKKKYAQEAKEAMDEAEKYRHVKNILLSCFNTGLSHTNIRSLVKAFASSW
jgi:uncharacterized coiled-coil DUF342 family protein